MNSTTNERKKKSGGVTKNDKLSQLPDDEIILRILSTLDVKSVVQTNILSKRWRYIWVSLPVLNLDDSSFDDSIFF